MTYKNYRYRHEKLCSDEIPPVRPQTKPKAKAKMMPQPKFKEEVELPVVEEPVMQPKLTAPVSKQVFKPQPNPLADITNHYKLFQEQYVQQKREKYNNLCQNMFAPKTQRQYYFWMVV